MLKLTLSVEDRNIHTVEIINKGKGNLKEPDWRIYEWHLKTYDTKKIGGYVHHKQSKGVLALALVVLQEINLLRSEQ